MVYALNMNGTGTKLIFFAADPLVNELLDFFYLLV